MSANQLAARVAAAMLAKEGTGPAWGVTIDAAEAGHSRIRMTLRDDMLNGHGTAHGGMIFALADTAFAYACNSANERAVAAHASITFIDAAQGGETLIAEARERAKKGRSGVYDVSVTTEDGRLVAEFRGLSRTIGGALVE